MLGETPTSETLGVKENKIEALHCLVNISNDDEEEQEDQVLFTTEA